MARGWESKSVESQMELAEARRVKSIRVKIDLATTERIRQRDSLLLSRTRILHDLDVARNPRYRQTLTAALKHLDDKLSELE